MELILSNDYLNWRIRGFTNFSDLRVMYISRAKIGKDEINIGSCMRL